MSNRRVEPRSIIGTGMASDPERLRDIQARQERMERDYALPKKRFGEVISSSPHPLGETELLDDDDRPVQKFGRPPPPDKRRKPGPDSKEPGPDAATASGADAGAPTTENPAPPPGAAPPAAADPAAARGDSKPPPKGPRRGQDRPVAGAANPGVAQSLGVKSRVTFRV